jgi:uncharacterized membrane protein YkoI
MKLHRLPPLWRSGLATIALLALPSLVFAEESEKPIKFDQLPAAAAKAIKAAAGGARLKTLSEEKEDGKPAYEAGWLVKGRKHEVTVGADGKVFAVEETIALEEAPAPVRETIARETGAGKVTSVELVKEKGKTLYEALIKKDKGYLEVVVDPKGKVVEREKKSRED